MKKPVLLIVLFSILLTQLARAQQPLKFSKTEDGLEYAFIKGKPKTGKKLAGKGDYIKISMEVRIKDSVIYTTGDHPFEHFLDRNLKNENAYLFGTPYEGLHMMRKGDSAVYRVNAGHFINVQKLSPRPKYDTTQYLYWYIKALDFESREAYEKRKQKERKSATQNFTRIDSFLDYKIISLGKGSQVANVGDHLTLKINYKINDSLVFTSNSFDNGNPVPQQIIKPMATGDLSKGFLQLQEGDSAIFRVKAKHYAKMTTMPIPAGVDSNDYHTWEVKVVTHLTQEERTAQQLEMMTRQNKIDDKVIQEYLHAKKYKDYKKTETGLYIITLKKGNGTFPEVEDKVAVNYTGMLTDGTVFDSNTDPKFNHVDPLTFSVGTRQVIRGWDEGLQHIDKGGRAVLIIPSSLAYGERGAGGQIPPNAVLIFEIELLDVNKK